MFKKIIIVITAFFIAHTVYAQSIDTTINKFCSALTGKDIINIHTRSVLRPFFISDNDLSNFIVYMNVRMENAGFKKFTVLSCKTKEIRNNGINAEGELEITGQGVLFFLKKHVFVSTLWINKDNQWYLESPSTINSDQ